jgi:hypothetical protein
VPPLPSAPTNVVSHLSGTFALLHWDGVAPAFIVERSGLYGWNVVDDLPGDVHESTVYAFVGYQFRIRAYGPDGSSPDAAIITIHSDPRTRSVRR